MNLKILKVFKKGGRCRCGTGIDIGTDIGVSAGAILPLALPQALVFVLH